MKILILHVPHMFSICISTEVAFFWHDKLLFVPGSYYKDIILKNNSFTNNNFSKRLKSSLNVCVELMYELGEKFFLWVSMLGIKDVFIALVINVFCVIENWKILAYK